MMHLQLINYINKIKVVSVYAILAISCAVLITSRPPGENFSRFQHPYLVTSLFMGYFYLILTFDFSKGIYVSRYKSIRACFWHTLKKLTILSTAYVVTTFLMFLLLGCAFGEAFVLLDVAIYLLNVLFSMLIVNMYYVMISLKVSALLSKIVVFCYICISYALNYYGGDIFAKYNFMMFCFNNEMNLEIALNSIMVYGTLIALCCLVLQSRGKEL